MVKIFYNQTLTFLRAIDQIIYLIQESGFKFILSLSEKSNTMFEKTVDREAINLQAEEILDHYGSSILRLSYSYLHNMSDAEEILQDTLIQFLNTSPTFENSTHKKAWLLRVAGNLSKNRIKYNKIRSTDELNEMLTADNREDLSFVWDAVKALPDKYREIIHLFYYEGYSSAEIALILGKNESTIRSNLHRGRSKLKEILKEEYDFEEII